MIIHSNNNCNNNITDILVTYVKMGCVFGLMIIIMIIIVITIIILNNNNTGSTQQCGFPMITTFVYVGKGTCHVIKETPKQKGSGSKQDPARIEARTQGLFGCLRRCTCMLLSRTCLLL